MEIERSLLGVMTAFHALVFSRCARTAKHKCPCLLFNFSRAKVNIISQKTACLSKSHPQFFPRQSGCNRLWLTVTAFTVITYSEEVTVVYNYSNCWNSWGWDSSFSESLSSKCGCLATWIVNSQEIAWEQGKDLLEEKVNTSWQVFLSISAREKHDFSSNSVNI